MKSHVSEFLLGGAIDTYQARDLILGFDTPIVNRINTGYQLLGSFRLSPTVTPMLNTIKGPYAKQTWEVATGSTQMLCSEPLG